jgi:8-oxo-dGTP pyrophosphatase MutT (NUDIX family)
LSAYTWPPDPAALGTPQPGTPEPTPAAVLVALFEQGGRPHLVLTRRRSDLRRHAGEISFPGGRRDAADADLAETALREAEEEIGLPRAAVSMIGRLEATSTFATNYVIHPFVASVPAGVGWRLSPREVEAVLELPLEDVRASLTEIELTRRGITFRTPAYVVGENTIWGATARIVGDLLERLEHTDGRLALRAP